MKIKILISKFVLLDFINNYNLENIDMLCGQSFYQRIKMGRFF